MQLMLCVALIHMLAVALHYQQLELCIEALRRNCSGFNKWLINLLQWRRRMQSISKKHFTWRDLPWHHSSRLQFDDGPYYSACVTVYYSINQSINRSNQTNTAPYSRKRIAGADGTHGQWQFWIVIQQIHNNSQQIETSIECGTDGDSCKVAAGYCSVTTVLNFR